MFSKHQTNPENFISGNGEDRAPRVLSEMGLAFTSPHTTRKGFPCKEDPNVLVGSAC